MTAKNRPLFRSVDWHKILCRPLPGKEDDLKPIEVAILLYMAAVATTDGKASPSIDEIAKGTRWSKSAVADAMAGDWLLDGSVTGLDASNKPAMASWKGARHKLEKVDDQGRRRYRRKSTDVEMKIEPVSTARAVETTNPPVGLAIPPAGLVGASAIPPAGLAESALTRQPGQANPPAGLSLKGKSSLESNNQEAKSFLERAEARSSFSRDENGKAPAEGVDKRVGARFFTKGPAESPSPKWTGSYPRPDSPALIDILTGDEHPTGRVHLVSRCHCLLAKRVA